MSKVERKEYQETKVMKTVSPVRSYSSQNLSQFDNSLDYLLDDLQSSVVPQRSGTFGNKTNSLNRVLRVNAANPVTEYTSDDAYSYSSPDGRKHVEGYKKESYSYKSSGGTTSDIKPEKTRVQTSINQLDSLLDDLKEVRKQPLQSSNVERSEKTVKRELHYDSSKKHQFETNGGYIQNTSSLPSSGTSTLTRQVKVKNLRESPIEVVETVCPGINPEILEHLDPSLRPPENTKVTTTIKTYTYEIPGSLDHQNTSSDISRKYITNTSSAYSPNESQTTPSKSFVYEKVENFENRKFQNTDTNTYETKNFKETSHEYKPYIKPNPPGWDENITETVTTRNYQPGTPRTDKEYFYNETVTTKNYKTPPPQKKTYIVEEMIDERIENYPPRSTPQEKTYYVEKTVNERNYLNDYREPPRKETYIYKETVNKNDIPYRNGGTNQPVNIKYKYTTTSSSTNNYKTGYPHDENDLLLPGPFPTEDRIDAPPKKLDELMNTIGREPPTSPLNAGFQQHERELMNEKKAKSMKQATEVEDLQRNELQKSKNVTGPPVYYPPGEMFAKKEESGAAWRAQGAYAREGGKYEYEASSKEKSKSSSGKAIVPVCLPLCCGLPCTIL